MFKTILVAMTGCESDQAALETALLAGGPCGAHIECLRIRPGPKELVFQAAATDVPGMISADTFELLRQEDKKNTESARETFEIFQKQFDLPVAEKPPGPGGVTIAWCERIGIDIDQAIAEARLHDLVVFGRAPDFTPLSPFAVGDVVMGCGRPVLLAPKQTPPSVASIIAIAWKESAEAARAVTASMPLIEKARKVFVLATPDGENEAIRVLESAEALRAQLRWHGISAETRCVMSAGQGAPATVIETAHDLDADLMVMGAYGRSRFREIVFGGFTHSVLKHEAPLPVLMFH